MINLSINRNAMVQTLYCFMLALSIVTPSMAVVMLSPGTNYLENRLPVREYVSYQPALDALANNEFQTAIDLAIGYVARSPGDAKAHLLLLLGWIGQGNEAAITKHFNELKSRTPKIFTPLSFEIAIFYANQKRYYKATSYLNDIPEADITSDILRLRGEILEIQGDMKGTIKTYESLLVKEADAPDVFLALARLYLLEGNPQKSLGYSQRLGQTGSELPVVHVLSGTAAMMLADITSARASFEQAVSLDDKNAIAWNQLGTLNLLAENYPAALTAYQRANASKDLNEAYLGIAYTSLYTGDTDNAIAALNKIAGRNSLATLTLAAANLSSGDSGKANAAYQQDAEIFIDFGMPGFDMVSYTKGDIANSAILLALSNDLYRQGYFTLNINLLEKHQDLLHSSAFLGLTYARSLWKSGNTSVALSTYDTILKQYPHLVAPVLEAADISFHNGDMDKALKGYQQASTIQPDSLSLRVRLAALYNHLDRPEDAIREFEAGLKLSPQSVYLLDQLASTYLEKLNNPEEALRYAEQALAKDNKNPDVKNTLAATYYASGQYEKAAELYLQLSSLNIANPAFYYDAGMSLLKANQPAQATSAFERVLDAGPAVEQYAAAETQYKTLIRTTNN